MNDFTPQELRELVARIDPRVMPPQRAAEELARVRLVNPALADAAAHFRAEFARLYDEMISLSPGVQHERLARLGAEDAEALELVVADVDGSPDLCELPEFRGKVHGAGETA